MKSPIVILFSFPEFCLPYKFLILQRRTLKLVFLWCYVPKEHRHRDLCHNKPPFWICVSLSISVTPSKPWWSKTSMPFEKSITRGEKKCVLTSYFLSDEIIFSWYEFQKRCKYFYSGFYKIQVPVPASLNLWCHQHWDILCCNHWIFKEESSMDHFVLQNPIKTINEGPYPPFPMEFQKPLKMQWHLSYIRVGDWARVLRLFRINIFVSWFHRFTGALICLSIFHKDSRELSFICITGVSIHNSIFLKTIILDSKPWSLDWQVWSWSDQASWAIVLVLGSWSDSPIWPCLLVSMIGRIQPTC